MNTKRTWLAWGAIGIACAAVLWLGSQGSQNLQHEAQPQPRAVIATPSSMTATTTHSSPRAPVTTKAPEKKVTRKDVSPKRVAPPTAALASPQTPTQNVANTPPPLHYAMEQPQTVAQAGEQLTKSGVITQTNRERATAGLPPLIASATLTIEAQRKADDMFALQYFAHVSPTGMTIGDLAREVGYAYIMIGENLAEGDFRSDAGVVGAWMKSPGHRANILKSGYKEIGVAAVYGRFEGRPAWIVVQEFGTPRSLCAFIEGGLRARIDASEQELRNEAAELEALQQVIENARDDIDQHNALVSIYNDKANIYNAGLERERTAVALYNQEVENENTCLAQYK